MNDGDRLLATVAARPDDDTARLVYADWLSEQGEESRADLIRIQIELQKWPERIVVKDEVTLYGHGPDYWTAVHQLFEVGRRVDLIRPDGKKKPMYGLKIVKEFSPEEAAVNPHVDEYDCVLVRDAESVPEPTSVKEMRNRAAELLEANPGWRPTCPACEGTGVPWRPTPTGGRTGCEACNGTHRIGEFRRGFVEVVKVPRLADVWEWPSESEVAAIGDSGPRPTAWVRDHLKKFLPLLREAWFGDVVVHGEVGGVGYSFVWRDPPPPVVGKFRETGDDGYHPTPDAARLALAVTMAAALRKACQPATVATRPPG